MNSRPQKTGFNQSPSSASRRITRSSSGHRHAADLLDKWLWSRDLKAITWPIEMEMAVFQDIHAENRPKSRVPHRMPDDLAGLDSQQGSISASIQQNQPRLVVWILLGLSRATVLTIEPGDRAGGRNAAYAWRP